MPTARATRLGMQRLDMHQQRLVAQVVPLCIAGTAHEVRVVAGCADKPDYFLSELNRSARDSFFRGKVRLTGTSES